MDSWILVVDDDAANLRMATRILSAEKVRNSEELYSEEFYSLGPWRMPRGD